MCPVSNDFTSRIDQLAELMVSYRLGEGELAGEGWRVAFAKRPPPSLTVAPVTGVQEDQDAEFEDDEPVETVEIAGTPINSPMTGIYYASSSPSAPDFVQVGDTVEEGQVVALIEAMKVFNEIASPVSGVVRKVAAKSGQVVTQGDPLIFIQ